MIKEYRVHLDVFFKIIEVVLEITSVLANGKILMINIHKVSVWI